MPDLKKNKIKKTDGHLTLFTFLRKQPRT